MGRWSDAEGGGRCGRGGTGPSWARGSRRVPSVRGPSVTRVPSVHGRTVPPARGSRRGEVPVPQRCGMRLHALGRQRHRRGVAAGRGDHQGVAREGVGALLKGLGPGRAAVVGGLGAQRVVAAAQPRDLLGDALGRGGQRGAVRRGTRGVVRCPAVPGGPCAQLVGDGEQRGQMSGELDVQLLLAGAVREVAGASAMVWTDLVRIGSYMGWPPECVSGDHPSLDSV